MSGPHSAQHTSDLIRLPLLYRFGGIYLDVGIMLFGNIERTFWDKVSRPDSPYRVGGFTHQHRINSWGSLHNFSIAAVKGEELIWRWHQVMLEVWKGRTHCTGMHKHPLFKDVPAEFSPRVLMVINDGWETNLADYSVHMLAWEKLKVTVDLTSRWNGPEYFQKHVLLYNPIEAFAADFRTRLNTYRLFQMLSSPRDAPGPDPTLYAEAQALIDYVITNSTMMKLYRGHGHMKVKTLVSFWEESEKENADVQPGTFGEYLRYAGEVIDQQREVTPMPLPPYSGPVVTGPLLEIN
jgi:hypothetical protein